MMRSTEYDEKHRLLEDLFTGFYEGKVIERSNTACEYDDIAKTFTQYNYSSKGQEELKLTGGRKGSLDENGRRSNDYVEVYNTYHSRGYSAKVQDPDDFKEYRFEDLIIASKDQKGNATVSYEMRRDGSIDNEGNLSSGWTNFNNYFEQTFEYYDGTVSKGGANEDVLEGGDYITKRLKDYELTGNVKTVKSVTNSIATWNKEQQAVELEIFETKVLGFDKAGVVTNVAFYYRKRNSDEDIKKDEYTNIEYDKNLRITSLTSYKGYNPPTQTRWSESTQKITYDDENKTATLIESFEHKRSKKVYRLAADGTISLKNYEQYKDVYLDRSQSVAVKSNQMPDRPSAIRRWIETKDATGNWTEQYALLEYKNKDELIESNFSIFEYEKREITYY